MPELLPFRGIRYAAARVEPLSRLVAPPYDLISPEQRAELAARSPHNVVHLILEPDRPGDGPRENKYLRSARTFESWLAEGVLKADPRPALYLVEQRFTGPGGRPAVRLGATAAVRLCAYGEGVILPHEKTLAAPRQDRLELVKSVKANLSPVFGLFEDPKCDGFEAVQALAQGDPVAEARTDDGVHHRLFRAEDPAAVRRLMAALASRKVFIADGHHRYEASLAYRDLVERERPGLPDGAGHRYLLMTLCSMSDPGLCIFPTHRLVFGLRDFRLGPFLDRLARFFEIETLSEDMNRPAGRAWAISKLAEHSGKSTTFLLVTGEDRRGRVLTLRDDADLSGVSLPESRTLRDLDVAALHAIVLQHLLGISPEAQEREENVRYEVDAGAAVNRVLQGEFPLGFLVNPTPIWQVQAVAEEDETMPQKSTYFFPKVASGLVMRRIDEPLAAPA